MKTVSLFFLFVITISTTYSQGKYKALPELEKFVGEWVSTEGGNVFKLTLVNEKKLIKSGNYINYIEGYLSFSKNFRIIQSPDTKSILSGSTIFNSPPNPNKITFIFKDQEKSKGGNGSLELIPGKPNQAKWKVSNSEGPRLGNFDSSFSVPTELILKKVK